MVELESPLVKVIMPSLLSVFVVVDSVEVVPFVSTPTFPPSLELTVAVVLSEIDADELVT